MNTSSVRKRLAPGSCALCWGCDCCLGSSESGLSTALVATAQEWGPELVIGTALMGVGLLFSVVQTTLAIPLNASLQLGTVTAIDVMRQGLTALAFAVLVAAGAGILPFLAVTIPITSYS